MLAELIVDIVAHVGNQKEALGELGLQLDEAALVAVLGGEVRRVQTIGPLLQPDDEVVAGCELSDGVPVILDAVAGRGAGRSELRLVTRNDHPTQSVT